MCPLALRAAAAAAGPRPLRTVSTAAPHSSAVVLISAPQSSLFLERRPLARDGCAVCVSLYHFFL